MPGCYGDLIVANIDKTNTTMTVDTVNNMIGPNTVPEYTFDVCGDINFTGAMYKNGVPYTGDLEADNYFESLGINCEASESYPLTVSGDINFTGVMYKDGVPYPADVVIPTSFDRLGVNAEASEEYQLNVSGDINLTGTLYLNGVSYVPSFETLGINCSPGGPYTLDVSGNSNYGGNLYQNGYICAVTSEIVDLTAETDYYIIRREDVGKTFLISLASSGLTIILPTLNVWPTNTSLKFKFVFTTDGTNGHDLVFNSASSDGSIKNKRIVTYSGYEPVIYGTGNTINSAYVRSMDYLELSSIYLSVSSLQWIISGVIQGNNNF